MGGTLIFSAIDIARLERAVGRLLEVWRADGLSLRAGATEVCLRNAAERLGLALPRELHLYLSIIDGQDPADDSRVRHDRITFWTSCELEISDWDRQAIVFADYMIRSDQLSIHSQTGAVYSGSRQLHSSLTEYIEAYLTLIGDVAV
jgi:cell wall assembly regulator SMI1